MDVMQSYSMTNVVFQLTFSNISLSAVTSGAQLRRRLSCYNSMTSI